MQTSPSNYIIKPRAYTIVGDTVTVVDACHAQNMHEENN